LVVYDRLNSDFILSLVELFICSINGDSTSNITRTSKCRFFVVCTFC